jgi:archaellum biogenesis ATPase FlaH
MKHFIKKLRCLFPDLQEPKIGGRFMQFNLDDYTQTGMNELEKSIKKLIKSEVYWKKSVVILDDDNWNKYLLSNFYDEENIYLYFKT